MKKLIALFILALPAYGSFLIEPYVGLNFEGGWQGDAASSKTKFNGQMYGARMGTQNAGLMLGLDARKGEWGVRSPLHLDLKYDHFGAFVGYNFPILLRVFAQYIFTGEAKDQNGNTYQGASGFVFGAGYKFFPYLSLNVESGAVSFRELELAGGNNLEDRSDKARYILFSVSLPITIGR